MDNKQSNVRTLPNGDVIVTKKRKKPNKKLYATVLIMSLTIVVAFTAVVAYYTQDFTVSNTISFRAQNIGATIIVGVTNAGNTVSLTNSVISLDPSDVDKKENFLEIPTQTFESTGVANAIVYTINIKNEDETPFTITLENPTNLIYPKPSSLNQTLSYKIGTENTVNGCQLSQNETFVLTLTIYLSRLETVDSYVNFEFVLQVA